MEAMGPSMFSASAANRRSGQQSVRVWGRLSGDRVSVTRVTRARPSSGAAARMGLAAALTFPAAGAGRQTSVLPGWVEVLVPVVVVACGIFGYRAVRSRLVTGTSRQELCGRRQSWIALLGRILMTNSIFMWVWAVSVCFVAIRGKDPELDLDNTLRVFVLPWLIVSCLQFGIEAWRGRMRTGGRIR